MPILDAFSTTLPVRDGGVGFDMETQHRRHPGRSSRLRMMLPDTTASQPQIVEIGDGKAGHRPIDRVVGDDRALKSELREDCDFAQIE